MLSGILQSSTVPVLEQVVNFHQSRHTILASNVANMNTPGYRVRDLSADQFHANLREAIQTRHEKPLQFSSGEVYDPSERAMRDVKDSLKGILYHDNSNVSIEQQIAEVSKNQAQHNLALSIMVHQFQLLQTAVSERV
jgi:flagellar basal-body rod protein FlgB